MVSYSRDKGPRWSFNRWLFRRGKRVVHPRNKTTNGYQHLTQLDDSFESVRIKEREGEREREREREKGKERGTELEQQNQCIVNLCRLLALFCTSGVQSNPWRRFHVPFPFHLYLPPSSLSFSRKFLSFLFICPSCQVFASSPENSLSLFFHFFYRSLFIILQFCIFQRLEFNSCCLYCILRCNVEYESKLEIGNWKCP